MKNFLNRFKEPSSWAGFAVLATLFGVPANTAQLVTNALVAVAAALAVILPEHQAGQ